jgi:hypothetical protein
MLHLALSAALMPLVAAAAAPLEVGTQLVYRGSIRPRAEQPDQTGKSFDLTLWVVEKSESGAEVFWLVDERGRGAFPWSERFGRVALDRRWQTAADGPAVLYDRGEGRTIVPIPLPLWSAAEPLAAERAFREGNLDYRVEGAAELFERPAWKLSARDPFGPKRQLTVEQESPLVLALSEKVIMGRGEEYELRLEFVGREQLAGESLAALRRASERLLTLRGQLNQPPRTQVATWNDQQLGWLLEHLPAVAEAAAATALERLTADAGRDLKLQAGRHDAQTELVEKFIGREVEDFTAKGLGDASLSRADLAGKVTVLHFWEYRDEPLEEPYGQVGYLDFMYHRRRGDGLQLFGVAVDGRLADDKTRAAAQRSVRKLQSFMNLSYPLLLDAGPLIKQFGDPRLVGANLPLFVVIGPDQKILHYHVGHYDVHQDQGLKELDEVIAKALQRK